MYLGPDKVVATVDNDDGSVSITLENGKVLKWPKKMYESCVTDKVSDATELSDARILRATQVIVHALLKEDVLISEIETLLLRISNFLNEKLDAATATLWRPHMKNEPTDSKLSGLQVLKDRTIGDLDLILTQKNDQKDTDSNRGESDTSSS